MPSRHGLEVSVTKTDRTPLIEYGSQSLGTSTKLSRIVTTRIEARDGLQFYIHVKPLSPFPIPASDLTQVNDGTSKKDPFFTLPPLPSDKYQLRPNRKFNEHSAIEQEEKIASPATKKGKKKPRDRGETIANAQTSLPRPKPAEENNAQRSVSEGWQSHPPFDIIAAVYIDGHEKPEARQVVHLNPSHARFNCGGFLFKGRWVSATEGGPPKEPAATRAKNTPQHIGIRSWVFSSIPLSVDDLTSQIAILSTKPTPAPVVLSETDQALADLTKDFSKNTLETDERPKPGQIEVRIRRIIAGDTEDNAPFRAYHYAGGDEDVELNGEKAGEECTHTTALKTQLNAEGKAERVRLHTVAWKPYKKSEEVYAKFIFNYMDRTKLVKLGLCDEDGKATLAGRISPPDIMPSKAAPTSRKRGADVGEQQDSSKRVHSTPGRVVTRSMAAQATSDAEDQTNGGDESAQIT